MSNELLERLQAEDVEGFNSQRSERGRVDLFAAELAGLKLAGVDLSRANLDKSDLTGTDFTDATLMKAYLSDIDGTGMVLRGVVGLQVKMRDAWIEEADLRTADLSRADLSGAVMKKTQGEGVRLMSARLKEADCTGAIWPEADLSESYFAGADFTGADLRRADLTEASGKESNFTNAHLDAILASRVKLGGANLTGASLVGARLDGANLAGANLTNAQLTGADLSRANLTGAILTGAVLQGAVFADACLDDVDLSGVDLADVDLSGLDPVALGLSTKQVDSLAASGAGVDLDTPLMVERPAAACTKKAAFVVWENLDSDEASSIRWAVLRKGKEPVMGALPMSGEAVLASAAVAVDGAFQCILLHDRPGGIVVVRYHFSEAGKIGEIESVPLGYGPGVTPVVTVEGGSTVMYGLARRGPTLVVHRESEEGLTPGASSRQATAKGFLGRHAPVLACKGGVLIPASPRGAGKPLRTPDGFPGSRAVAIPHEDRVLAAWVEPARTKADPGGLKVSWLAARGAPQTELLSASPTVFALDARHDGERVLVAWAEERVTGVVAFLARLPGEEVIEIPLEVDATNLELASTGEGLLLTTFEGLAVVDFKGKVIGSLS